MQPQLHVKIKANRKKKIKKKTDENAVGVNEEKSAETGDKEKKVRENIFLYGSCALF